MSLIKAENKKNLETKLIPLATASKKSGYTPEYLNSLARKGELKAEKIGRNWYTTQMWLEEFLEEVSLKKKKEEKNSFEIEVEKEVKVDPKTEEIFEAGKAVEEDGIEEKVNNYSLVLLGRDEKTEAAEPIAQKIKRSSWVHIFAGLSSMVIVVPMILLVIYSTKYYLANKKFEAERIALAENAPQGEIFNENDLNADGSTASLVVSGIVQGVTTSADDESAKKAGILLASENYKASSVSLGGEIVLTSSEENMPLEISDIKSESFITSKSNNSSGNSTEEVKLVVSWKTNKLAMSEIDYSKNNGQDPKAVKEQSYGFYHSVVLSQIDPRTSYVYQVKGRDHWGNAVSSDFFGIFTASKPVSVFDLISKQINDIFGWAIKK